jgi:S-layer protein (TIGR01564 family)
MGVIAVNSYKNIAGTAGSGKVYVADNLKTLELGENYDSYFKIYGVVPADNDTTSIDVTSTTNIKSVPKTKLIGTSVNYSYTEYQIDGKPLIGIALVRTDDTGDMAEDSVASFLSGYYKIKAENYNSDEKTLDFLFAMDVSKELKLAVGDSSTVMGTDVKLKAIDATAQEVVPVKAPIAKLDTEVSLDTADKNLILVGGPVVNALTKALVDAGQVAIDNESPATLAVVEGAANGNDVLVVAGGNREATREAALDLIENY